MSGFAPTVTVVVNTLGRPELLADTLRGLARLRWADLEIVAINGRADEATEAVLAQWAGKIKTGICPEENLAVSRNIGLSLAGGEIIAFIDDDAIPHPAWLEKLTTPFRNPEVGAVGGYTIGRLGTSYQSRTTLCDRYGDPYFVSDDLDLRRFCKAGSWLYPSLLGTNCSFRRDALVEAGGFDETFSYYLEETDLCLRLVDAGWQLAYVPEALIWHQFASSALRSADMTRRSIRAVMRSQSYFINRHGLRPWSPVAAQAAADRLAKLQVDWTLGNKAARNSGAIDHRHAAKLDRELAEGLAEGFALAQARANADRGHWRSESTTEFRRFPPPAQSPLRIALVCRNYADPREPGIPRWTRTLADALASRGHTVHIVCETKETAPRIRFTSGVWTHEIACDCSDYGWISERYGMPAEQAQWAATVRHHVGVLQSFGLDLLSFPIWDLEGMGCLDVPGLTVCMSLHTTYSLAARFREDWASQPLLRERLVAPMIAAERIALNNVEHLLSNSDSIVSELEHEAGGALSSRTRKAVHGVPGAPSSDSRRHGHILFVGRFEHRKGVDIALAAVVIAGADNQAITATFVGDGNLREAVPAALWAAAQAMISSGRLEVVGPISRDQLNAHYSAADVALLPSRYESFGLVAVEAMVHGCVVATLNCGGMAEVVEPDSDGILVPADEHCAERLGRAIGELLADETALRARQMAARHKAEQAFSVERMAEQVEEAYMQFLGREMSSNAIAGQ